MSEPIRTTVDILRARFPQPDKIPSHNLIHQAANELEKALADSALKTVRILELEKELAAAGKDAERLDWLDEILKPGDVNDIYERINLTSDSIDLRDAIDAAITSRQQDSE